MNINNKTLYMLGLALTLAITSCSNNSNSENGANADSTMTAPAADTIRAADTTPLSASPVTPQVKDDTVVMKTDAGTIKLRVYGAVPQHRANFIKLCNEGFYNGLLFHRVIDNFMIQGGDPDSKNAKPGQPLGAGGLSYNVPAEINPMFRHKRGALAAARQGDQVNPERQSSACQFYICHVDVPQLDGQYTVFGEVLEGMEVVDKIATAKRDPNDRPMKDIHIISTKVITRS